MKKFAQTAATTLAMTAGLGLAGLGVATAAQAHPGPAPLWCPGDYWDPGWGDNWDWNGCHDNFRPGYDRGPGWDRDPGWDHGPGPGDRGPDRGDDHRR